MKCGICQLKSAAARTAEPASKLPDAAAHPINGGMAPTRAPTQVLTTEICLSGVYTPA